MPIGLDTPEGVLVGNIDSLRMENGMVPVVNSAVKYYRVVNSLQMILTGWMNMMTLNMMTMPLFNRNINMKKQKN